jgi:hypothetical protein
VVLEVVSTSRVPDTDEVPVIFTVDGMLHVGRSLAPPGDVVTAQERSTTPTNPFEGVTVTIEVLPDVAPAATEMDPLFLRAKPDSETVMVAELLDPP